METAAENIPDPEAENANAAALSHLGPNVLKGFEQAAQHRRSSGVENELMECLRQAKSEYSAQEIADIKAKGAPVVYVGHSALKARTANSLVSELFLNSSDPPYTFDPTPVPEISEDDAAALAQETISEYQEMTKMDFMEQGMTPDEADEAVFMQGPPEKEVIEAYVRTRRDEIDSRLMEEARLKVDRMLKKVRDQLGEGLFREAMSDCIYNAAHFGTCILKGPLRKSRKRVVFKGGACKLESKEVLECSAVSPLDAYPAKGAVSIQDGDFYERVRFTPKELNSMRKMGDGYFAEEISAVLARYPNGGLKMSQPNDSERQALQNDGNTVESEDSMLEGIEAWKDVRGSMLIELGIVNTDEGTPIDAEDYHPVNCIVMDGRVIFCTLTDEKFGRPLYKGVFYRTPGSWWGTSPMNLMRDLSRMWNATLRDLCVNNAHASGPMMDIIDVSRMVDTNDTAIVPWGYRKWKNPNQTGDVPFRYTHTTSIAPELQNNMDWLEKQFDIVTSIPAYSHGSDTAAGAGRTYNGLLLMTTASKQGINTVNLSLFFDVVKPLLEHVYRYNMLFDEDDGIKGDCEVVAGGLLAIMVREQSLNRLLEILKMTQNPSVAKVLGDSGIAELLRQYIKLLQGVNPDKIVPSEKEIERRAQLAAIEARLAQAEKEGMAAEGSMDAPVAPGTTPPVPTGQVPQNAPRPMSERMLRQPVEEVA